MEKDMDKENFNGIMAKFFKVNGNQVQKMVMESGNHRKATIMKATGFSIDNMEKVFINTRIAPIKVSLRIS